MLFAAALLTTWCALPIVVSAATQSAVVAGSFSQFSQERGNGIPVSTVTGDAITPYANISGTVTTVVADGDGGWYVGGSFLKADGTNRSGLAHILSNGSLDDSWTPTLKTGLFSTGSVLALARDGGTLYVAGSFTTVDGVARAGLAAVDTGTGNVLGWNPNPSGGSVEAIALSGSTIFVGGTFTTIGGESRSRVAELTGTGAATAWNPNVADNAVLSISTAGSGVYIGGSFTTVNAQTRNHIALIDASGSVASWDPNADGNVEQILLSGNVVYVGGTFATIGGGSRAGIAALSGTSGLLTDWNVSASCDSCTLDVRSLSLNDSLLYAGGTFTTIGGGNHADIAALRTSDGSAASWDPAIGSGAVQAIGVSGSTAYIGGTFGNIGGEKRTDIAVIDPVTGKPTDWMGPTAISGGTILSVAANGTTIYVGGSFTGIDGQTREHVAAFDRTTGNLLSWYPAGGTNGQVNTVALTGSTLYIGGSFTSVGGIARINMASLDAQTAAVENWNPGSGAGTVYDIVPDSGTVWIGGDHFGIAGGSSSTMLDAVDSASGSEISGWSGFNFDGAVYAVLPTTTTLYVGGAFQNIGENNRASLASFDRATHTLTSWAPNLDVEGPGHIDTLTLTGSILFYGATEDDSFQELGAAGAVDATGSGARIWFPSLRSSHDGDTLTSANAIVLTQTGVLVAGGFDQVDGQQRDGIARFAGDPSSTADTGTWATDGTLYAMALLPVAGSSSSASSPSSSSSSAAASSAPSGGGGTVVTGGHRGNGGNPYAVAPPSFGGAQASSSASSSVYCSQTSPAKLPMAGDALAPLVGGDGPHHGEQLSLRDVLPTEWYAVPVFCVMEAGVAAGYDNQQGQSLGIFKPLQTITYAELARMSLELAKTTIDYTVGNDWYEPYFAAAKAQGLTLFSGTEPVDPSAQVTRGAFILTLLQALHVSYGDAPAPSFTDVPLHSPYAAAIATAQQMGLIRGDVTSSGWPTNTFRPNDPISRAEVTMIVTHAMELPTLHGVDMRRVGFEQ